MKLEKKRRDEMYGFVDRTRNPITGRCPFACDYCYAKGYHHSKPGVFILDESALNNLGEHRTIFIGSRIDMWNNLISSEILSRILQICRGWINEYLFQSKNPKRFADFISEFPPQSILCTTIETNREDLVAAVSKAPSIHERVKAMQELNWKWKMVTIEPIMEFDLPELMGMIEAIKPQWINIGADSKGHHLPEPAKEKVIELENELRKEYHGYLILKSNLSRLLEE